jgi:hypothetical protein
LDIMTSANVTNTPAKMPCTILWVNQYNRFMA